MKKLFKLFLFVCLLCPIVVYAQTGTHVPKEGEVAMKTGRVMVLKDGQWVQIKENITMKNGTTISTEGMVMMKDGKQDKLAEGEYVTTDGQIKQEKVKTSKTTETKMKKGVE